MKKQIVEAQLRMANGQEIVTVKGKEGYTDVKTLLAFLRSDNVKACVDQNDKGYKSYKYKVEKDGELNNYFVIRIKNNERYLHKETMKKIADINKFSILSRKYSLTKKIVALTSAVIILTVAGPTIAKGLNNLLKKDHEYDQNRYHQHSITHQITEEEKRQAEIEYYKRLKEQALKGNEEAKQEYEEYEGEQQLKAQIEESKSKGTN